MKIDEPNVAVLYESFTQARVFLEVEQPSDTAAGSVVDDAFTWQNKKDDALVIQTCLNTGNIHPFILCRWISLG